MKVLVDTSIWSIALRRSNNSDLKEVKELAELIREMRVVIIGSVRQELLSGIPESVVFESLKEKLQVFEDFNITTEDYEFAAELFNRCRKKGIQGSHIDYLICAVSLNNGFTIFTADKDFERYREHTGIKLHTVRNDL